MARWLLFLVGMRVVVLTSLLVGCGFGPAAHDVQGDAQGGADGVTGTSCHSQQPDLRLCLDFEDTSLDPVVEDLSTGNHDASTILVDPSRRDHQQAAAITWGSTITIPESADLDIPKNLTIEMWINPDSDANAFPLTNAAQYSLAIDQQAAYSTFGNQHVHAKKHIEADTWTHVACTYDGATVTAYINGDVSACKTSPPTMIANVGATGTQVGLAYNGAIDDVHVYARTLTPPQIQALANMGGATACTGKDN